MHKSIITIGVNIPDGQTKYTPLQSKLSLLDYDISIFDPNIDEFYGYHPDDYLGKPSLDDYRSFQLKEHCDHWRREIIEAVKAGKTVFMLLNELEEVYVATGQKLHSGTGRSQRTTRIVELYTNYRITPDKIEVVNSSGKAMKLHAKENILATYWAELGPNSEYRVLINGAGVNSLVVTKTGEKTVGASIRYQNTPGMLVLLPYIDFNRDEFIYEREKEIHWTAEGIQLGKQFVSAIIAVNNAIRAGGAFTPAPDWLAQEKYVLPKEEKIRTELLSLETQIESLQNEKEQLQQTLVEETVLRGLLYEKGKPLEAAIMEGLKLIGFNVARYKDIESEFDVIFYDSEFRFNEGKNGFLPISEEAHMQ